MSSSIGRIFVVTSLGESHGPYVGVVVDGCPASVEVDESLLERDLARRRAVGQTGATPRSEPDVPRIISGVLKGKTTGAPICMLVENVNVRSDAYSAVSDTPRPGHADYVAREKYRGLNDPRGGGRFSGRITAGFVMAGTVAREALRTIGIEVFAHTMAIGGISAAVPSLQAARDAALLNELSCADSNAASRMKEAVLQAASEGDSVGGVIETIATGVPVGLGEPVFDSVESVLAHAFYSIPAVKGVEFGAGFAVAGLRGSTSNDPFIVSGDRISTAKNDAGGILGGISQGMPVVARVAIKPTASIAVEQETVRLSTLTPERIAVTGRHDACIVPRAVVVVESMMAVGLCDLALSAGVMQRVVK